jgi:hypothetical protein
MVGNRGTEVGSGESNAIDTAGPAVTLLSIAPSSPVKNDENQPVLVTVTLGVNEAIKAGTLPELSLLSRSRFHPWSDGEASRHSPAEGFRNGW